MLQLVTYARIMELTNQVSNYFVMIAINQLQCFILGVANSSELVFRDNFDDVTLDKFW